MTLTVVAFTSCFLAALGLFIGSRYTSSWRIPLLLVATIAAVAMYAAVLVIRPSAVLVLNAAVLLVAMLLGSSLGTLIRGRIGLVSFSVAAAIVDITSYLGGVTATLNQSFAHGTSQLLPYLCVSVPVQGRLRPIVGIGDLVIVAALYFALRRLGHSGVLMFLAPVAGLWLALATGLLVGGVFAIPFIATTTLSYVWLTAPKVPLRASAPKARGGHA
jgi:hypothetical protein